MSKFYYNTLESYENNFKRWYLAKRLENEMYNIFNLTEDKARASFDSLYAKKKIKITRIKTYE